MNMINSKLILFPVQLSSGTWDLIIVREGKGDGGEGRGRGRGAA